LSVTWDPVVYRANLINWRMINMDLWRRETRQWQRIRLFSTRWAVSVC